MVQTTQDMKQVYIQAMQLLSGHRKGLRKDPKREGFAKAMSLLRLAAPGLPPAQSMLATLSALGCDGKVNDAQACDMFLKAAMSGFPPAVRGLAICLCVSENTLSMGAGLLRRAASAGDWIAAFLLLREAERGTYMGTRADLIQLSAMLSPSVPFREVLQTCTADLGSDIKPIRFAPFVKAPCEVALKTCLSTQITPKKTGSLHKAPDINSLPDVLPPLLCDYLIATTTTLMQPSKVVEETGAVKAQYRTSDGAVLLPAQMDFVHMCILRRLSRLADINPEQGEFLSLLRYKPGQEYRSHHDFLEEDKKDYSKVKACGQRTKTLLTYLNEGYDGGATEFPELSLSYSGKTGHALVFENTDITGKPYVNSLHAGVPVTSGEKWLATLWCRERPFWPWMRE